jgi:hypothetical protein
MIMYSDVLWRQIVAGLGMIITIFVCNDVSKVLMIAYMNRPEVLWIPIFKLNGGGSAAKHKNDNNKDRLILRIV